MIAVTGPNGNQESTELVNLLGAANLFLNPDFTIADPNSPTALDHWSRSSSSWTINPDYANAYNNEGPSLPISLSGHSWSQNNRALHEGADYLAKARFQRNSDLFFSAEFRNLEGSTETLSRAQSVVEPGPDGWDLLEGLRFKIPGNSQFTPGNPSLVGFSAKWNNEPNSVAGRLDDLSLHMLSVAYKRNKDGQVRSVTGPDGAESVTRRDRFNRVVSTEDPSGEETRLVYDASDRVIAIIKPGGETLEFAYNEVGALVSFKDERDEETTFSYDNLNRLTTITYPDTSTEVFAYDAVSNLTSYTDNQSQTKTFAFDDADRLVTITYPDTDTVAFGYDEVNNLTSMTEKNGDTLAYGYDAADRLISVVRTADSGNSTPEWEHTYTYDETGNRISLSDGVGELWSADITDEEGPAEFGTARYDLSHYPAGRDSLNRLVGVKSQGKVQARFAYDHEGRRTETEFANRARTKATFDIVGRLRDLVTTSYSGELLSLSYDYDIRSNRSKQVTGFDTFDCVIDADGKLVGENVNRLVEEGIGGFQSGNLTGLSLENDGLELLPVDDSFSGSAINSDRWRLTYRSNSNVDNFIGAEVRQKDGLHMVFPRGYSDREGHGRYIYHDLKDNFGATSYHLYTLMEHRRRLEGDFDVRVELASFQGYASIAGHDAQAMLYVSVNPSETYPTRTYMHLAREHDNGFVVRSNGVLDSNMTAFDGPVTFRLVRVASTITAYAWNEDTTSWDTQSGWERTVTDASLYVGLAGYVNLQGYVAATFKNFVFNANSTPGYTTTGEYLSPVYDAGHPVDWKSLKLADRILCSWRSVSTSVLGLRPA